MPAWLAIIFEVIKSLLSVGADYLAGRITEAEARKKSTTIISDLHQSLIKSEAEESPRDKEHDAELDAIEAERKAKAGPFAVVGPPPAILDDDWKPVE